MGVFSKLFGAGTTGGGTKGAADERAADVVVVGAGLAGLFAARTLAAAGVDVVVLEARDRVGGRTFTQPAADGTLIDLGGQWMGPTQHRLAALAAEVGSTTFKTFDTGRNIEIRGGVRSEYSGAIPTHDPLAMGDVVEAMLNLNMQAMQVPLEAPWQTPDAVALDSQTMATWLAANVASDNARGLLELGIQAVFSAEPRDLSLLHCLFYIRSGGGLMDLLGVTAGAQESRFHEGAQSLSNKMAAALGARVILYASVRALRHDAAGVRVEADGVVVRAQRAIVAIPPPLAGRLRYDPILPGRRDMLTQRMPMGVTFKIHAIYPTPFWRGDGLTGQATSDVGPVRLTFDNTPDSGAPGVLMGFVEGPERWTTWALRSPEERRSAALAGFTQFFGERAAQPLDYIEHSWVEEEFSRGCYAAYMPPGVWTSVGEALRAPIGRLHWAGTETATVWNGYMDGALQSGERAAHEVMAALGIVSPAAAGGTETR